MPSNLAHSIVNSLMEYGEVRRGTIEGIRVESVAPAYAREVNAPGTNGALVVEMSRDSDAYASGLRPGDIITAVNGQAITDPSHLIRLLADAHDRIARDDSRVARRPVGRHPDRHRQQQPRPPAAPVGRMRAS